MFARSSKIHNGRDADRLPVASRQAFLRTACSRPARTRTRCAAAGQGDYFPRVITLPRGSAPCSANTTLLGCQAVGHCARRRQLRGGRVARRKPPQTVGMIDGRSLVAEPRGYGQSGARGESGCRAEARAAGAAVGETPPSERKCFETGFFLRHVARRQPSQDAREA